MAKAVGIDLGTTNSVVSTLEAGEPVVIPNAEGSRTTPSVVAFSKTGEVLVGEVAKRQAITNPDRTIRSVKRHMGTNWTIDIDGKAYTPQEISARILQKLKRDAEAYLGDTVTQAVITVPGVLRRRRAPGHQGGRRGRGTRGPAHHQRADRGRARLRPRQGARPHDPRLRPRRRHVRRVGARARRGRVRGQVDRRQHPPRRRRLGPARHRLDGRASSRTRTASTSANDKMATQRLKEAAEKAKIELSSLQETSINLPFITATPDGPLHLELTLSPGEVPGAHRRPARGVQGSVRAGDPRRRASTRTRSTASMLVGGSTRMPAVAGPGARPHRQGAATRASTPTRPSRSAPRSRPACSRATSRTSCSST